jgi:hypothetical protein
MYYPPVKLMFEAEWKSPLLRTASKRKLVHNSKEGTEASKRKLVHNSEFTARGVVRRN